MDRQSDTYGKSQHIERFYRKVTAPDLQKYRICIGESDLLVQSVANLKAKLTKQLKHYRRQLKEYIETHPAFATSLTPVPTDSQAPALVQWMIAAAATAGMGPMAAVAGAIAGMLGKGVETDVGDLIIENGGDIYLRSSRERIIAVYAGASVFSNRIGIKIPPCRKGVGICTSAGTVGPSLSFGRADASVIVAPDVALADAVATATGNLVRTPRDFNRALEFARNIPGITGVLIVKDNRIAAWGQMELMPLI